ncbi:methionyl-tRNA formyltransferase [Dethiosulfatarculus sandiegensis]|uniref:Methionyl-tRNA formyltransferase n=1 Tax=Dethiosulfatarculus sandiegensis TaxID=1429043 RepID=A0A0D2HZ70_9BACT|nr:methionyl-tRNA formyltransferase [Dethiosulfatarculus sandiegensis]KIX15533.1 methionyl-tRNA formyltransferase [Dethiosulfatarculus sandiegensis]
MRAKTLVFMGTPDIACPTLTAASKAGWQVKGVVTQPDRPAGRGKKVRRCPVAAQADDLGFLVLQPERIAALKEELKSLDAQACVVMAMGQILPKEILDIFPLGCVNLHTSLLPLLRGASPINQAIIQGFDTTGVTAMMMDQGMDTGHIIMQEELIIDMQETAGSLADRLSALAADLLPRTLEALWKGEATWTPQDGGKATYAPVMKKTDGLLDWNKSAEELDRQVRGMDPWPSAFTSLNQKQLRLFAPTCLSDFDHKAKPGTVLPPQMERPDMLWVACGQGALGLGQVQAAGKRRMEARNFIHGLRDKQGFCLGE